MPHDTPDQYHECSFTYNRIYKNTPRGYSSSRPIPAEEFANTFPEFGSEVTKMINNSGVEVMHRVDEEELCIRYCVWVSSPNISGITREYWSPNDWMHFCIECSGKKMRFYIEKRDSACKILQTWEPETPITELAHVLAFIDVWREALAECMSTWFWYGPLF